jgi:hypothetical protein
MSVIKRLDINIAVDDHCHEHEHCHEDGCHSHSHCHPSEDLHGRERSHESSSYEAERSAEVGEEAETDEQK